MEGSEIKKMLFEQLMTQDGIDPKLAKWLLKFEEILTRHGEEIEALKARTGTQPPAGGEETR